MSQWKPWTSWDKCTSKCGRGIRVRWRRCKYDRECSVQCKGRSAEVVYCFTWCCEAKGKLGFYYPTAPKYGRKYGV